MSPKASTRLLATQSDERLVELARAGHDRAFEALVQRYRSSLLRYCRRLRLSDARAEDVVQQSFLQAWTALRRGAQVRELRPWLYRVTHNTAVNAMRDADRNGAQPLLLGDRSADEAPTPTVELDASGRMALRETLSDMAALPQMQREVIFRTAVAGQSHEEVASMLGITDGAVRGLLYRARATLREAVTALTPPPLLAWIVGSGQAGGGERLGEVAAGGGAGLASLAVKGGVVAITAGTLLTGAVIEHNHAHASTRTHHTRSASVAGGSGDLLATTHSPGAANALDSERGAADGHSTATRNASGGARRRGGGGALSFHVSYGTGHTHGARPGSNLTPGAGTHTVSTPSSGSGSSGQTPNSSTGNGRGGTGANAGGGAKSESTGGAGSTSGSAGGSSGAGASGGNGAGAGGAGGSGGSGSGGSGAGGSGGSGGSGSGGSGGGGGSGAGGSSGGSGSGGSTGSGSGSAGSGSGGGSGAGGAGAGSGSSEGASPGGGSGSGSAASSPVGTVVHEVTGLLENTVHGLLH